MSLAKSAEIGSTTREDKMLKKRCAFAICLGKKGEVIDIHCEKIVTQGRKTITPNKFSTICARATCLPALLLSIAAITAVIHVPKLLPKIMVTAGARLIKPVSAKVITMPVTVLLDCRIAVTIIPEIRAKKRFPSILEKKLKNNVVCFNG